MMAGQPLLSGDFYTSPMQQITLNNIANLENRTRRFGLRGFTLIELLITIAILAIVLALGLPSLREFLIRNQVSSISSEFSSDVSRTRIEAISRNSCVTMCSSTNTNSAAPSCSTAGNNWQTGWIIFATPTCNTSLNTPDATNTLISVRQQGATTFELVRGTSAMRRMMFDSRGLANGIQSNFTLIYVPEGVSSPHYRTLCLSSAGRVRTKKYGESCP